MHDDRWLRVSTMQVLLLVLLLAITVAPAQASQDASATPVIEASGRERLVAMLGQLPTMPLFDIEQGEVATISYVNHAAQLAAVGVEPVTSYEDPAYDRWFQAVRGMPPVIWASDLLIEPETETTFGFTPFQVDQSVEYHLGDVRVTVLRGRFDEERVETAFLRSGYQPVTVDGMDFLSIANDGEINFDSPIGLTVAGGMENAAFLADGSLVFSSTRDSMRATLEVAAGGVPTLADQEDMAPLLNAIEPDLVAAWITSGLDFAISDPFAELAPLDATSGAAALPTREAERGEMPSITTVLLGMTAGGPLPGLGSPDALPEPPPPGMPLARLQIGLLMPDRTMAEAAGPVLEDRLDSMRTGSSSMRSPEVNDRPLPISSLNARCAFLVVSQWSWSTSVSARASAETCCSTCGPRGT